MFYVFLAIAAFIIIGIMAKKKNHPTATAQTIQYQAKKTLMNKSELTLYQRLAEAAPSMTVFCQVSMSQIFEIDRRTKDGFKKLGEVGMKSIDFMICRSDTSIIAAIELDGPDHKKSRQKASDNKKDMALNQAGIPLIRIKTDSIPDVASLRQLIAPHIVARNQAQNVTSIQNHKNPSNR